MPTVISIKEYEKSTPILFSSFERQLILDDCGAKLSLTRPLDGDGYWLSASSYVGVFNIDRYRVIVEPKVPVTNVFKMLTFAYDLADFYDRTEYASIQELFEYLIEIFQKKILKLAKEGLFANYIQLNESLHYLKGRLDMPVHLKNSWRRDKLNCAYNEYSIDIRENRIIRFTLDKLLRMRYENEHIHKGLIRTKRYFESILPQQIFQSDFNAIQYHVLNNHYKPIHQFCKMIFDLIGIHERMGDAIFNAYSVDMNVLFEKYVGRLLQENLGSFQVILQKHIYFDDEKELGGRPDIIIYQNRIPRLVLDTKYKAHESLSMDDVNQMFHYMDKLRVDGVLLYPNYNIKEKVHTFGRHKLYVKTVRLDDIKDGAAELLDWMSQKLMIEYH